ncbi:MAG TPA: diguanylate cyclase, partial [Burkholderiaceae bacterium]
MLGLAVALLTVTAMDLVVHERVQVWRTAHENMRDEASSMQSSITAVLTQSLFSLQGVRSDFEAAPSWSSAAALAALGEAARFDSISAYLGFKSPSETILVGARGVQWPQGSEIDLGSVPTSAPDGHRVRFGKLLRIEGDPRWFLPLLLDAPARAPRGVLFALVPTNRLLGGAESLRVRPESFFTLFTTDGERLLRFMNASELLEPNGKRVPPAVLTRTASAPNGSFASHSTVDGRATVFGYSRSADLPLIVSAGVPESALTAQWMSNSMAPAAVLATGLLALLVFGLLLRRSIREHGAYVAGQEYLARHDQLTGLPNRYAFLQFMDNLISSSTSRGKFCVLLLDVNRFKDVNDTLGHAAGDEVLQVLGRRLQELLLGSPVCVARLGGDEIAICVAGRDASQTDAVATF